MKNSLKVVSLAPLCLALFACGGGGGGNSSSPSVPVQTGQPGPATGHVTNPVTDPATTDPAITDPTKKPIDPAKPAAAQRVADGVWLGTNSLGSSAVALTHDIGDQVVQMFFVDRPSAGKEVAKFYSVAKFDNGAFKPGFVDEYRNQGLSKRMEGGVTADNVLSSGFHFPTIPTPEVSYKLSYSNNSDHPVSLDQLKGWYSSSAGAPNFHVDEKGLFSGELNGCAVSGKLKMPDPAKNLYMAVMYAKRADANANCQLNYDLKNEVLLVGLASLVTLPNEKTPSLVLATSTSASSASLDNQGKLLGGVLTKQP